MSSSSDPPVALSTDVVLLHIFQYLGVNDLLECRLVNQKWQAIASEALYSRHLYIDPEKLFAVEDETVSTPWAAVLTAYSRRMRFLAERIRNNSSFRFLGFVFTPDMMTRSAWESFREFGASCGKYIRRLRIDDAKGNKLPEIFALFSEIEHVGVGCIRTDARATETDDAIRFLRLNGSDITLPNLRYLQIIDSHYLETENAAATWKLCEELMMRNSPALKMIEGFDVRLTGAALRYGKLKTVTDVDLRFPMRSLRGYPPLSDLKMFSEHSPALESMAFQGFFRLVFRDLWNYDTREKQLEFFDSTILSLDRILTASKDTLKHLVMDFLDIPQKFTKLSRLHIVNRGVSVDEVPTNAEPYRIFPPEWGLSPSSLFPALKTVRLELEKCQGASVKTYFGESQDDKFVTVTTLELACRVDSDGIQALADTFPNVRTLRVFWRGWAESYLSDLWLFSAPDLKVVEIFNLDIDSEDFQEFDASITGFYVEICENLRKRHRIPYDDDHLDAFRTNPSIVKLRGLQRLSVNFTCTDPEYVVEPDSSISPIAYWYGFGLMPNLETEFVYDRKDKQADVISKALEPYKSYVSIVPR